MVSQRLKSVWSTILAPEPASEEEEEAEDEAVRAATKSDSAFRTSASPIVASTRRTEAQYKASRAVAWTPSPLSPPSPSPSSRSSPPAGQRRREKARLAPKGAAAAPYLDERSGGSRRSSPASETNGPPSSPHWW